MAKVTVDIGRRIEVLGVLTGPLFHFDDEESARDLCRRLGLTYATHATVKASLHEANNQLGTWRDHKKAKRRGRRPKGATVQHEEEDL